MHARAVAIVMSLALAFVVAACGSSGGSPAADGKLTVDGAWVRAAEAGAMSAAYMTLANGHSAADALVGVSAPDLTDSASLHETSSDASGMTGMHHTDSVAIPAGGTVALEPGGYHIMLMDLKKELKAGDRVTLILTFEQAGVVNVDAEVRATDARATTRRTMYERPAPTTPPPPEPAPIDRRVMIAGGLVLAVLAGLVLWLVAMAAQAPDEVVAVTDAPALELTDQAGQPFSLASLRGHPVLVFFGYTHCPDVCPATIGILNQVLADAGDGPRAIFISIDPDRDGPAEMASYLKYLPKAYTGLSGTPEAIATNAARWGVKYAKVDEGSPDGYGMAHTADVFLVDAQGRLRGRYPFGTEPGPMTAAVKGLLAETPVTAGPIATSAPTTSVPPIFAPTAAPTVAPSSAPTAGDLRVLLVSSSVWAGPQTPVIVTLSEPDGTPLDGAVRVSARIIGANETATGADVPATTILPTGASRASYVATVQIPVAGWWRLDLLTSDGRKGSVAVEALDPGSSAAIGAPAPDVDTPTLADVGGQYLAITTQEAPDLRFYEESTADARAAGRPYVLVIDSSRFKVSPACGRALTMADYLIDRWGDNVAFIHLEPFVYQVITQAPVLSGDIANPPLDAAAAAFGLGDSVWPATDMPWIFVVDGNGTVRAKYRSIVGTADIDVILSLIEGRGVQ